MPRSKFKYAASLQAVRRFTDRRESQRAFWDAIEALGSGPGRLRVLVYYGVGGIGKTKLIRHLYEELGKAAKEDPALDGVRSYFLSLDAYEFSSPTTTLLALRNQLGIPCFLFDYALLKYWTAVGTSPLEIKKKGISKDSLIWDFLEFVGDLGGAVLPIRLLSEAFDRARQYVLARSDANADQVSQIDSLAEAEIVERLPYYLGCALREEAERSGTRFVLFFDSVEDPEARALTVRGSADGWLSELVAASERGLFVLAGREFVRWANRDAEWREVLEQHLLGRLSESDAEFFLSEVPIEDAGVRRAIMDLADGLPLYLDLCVTIFAYLREQSRPVRPQDFRMPQREVVERFLDHLPRPEREATRLVAVVRSFDRAIFAALVREFSVGYPMSQFERFVGASHISEIDSSTELFKVHDTVRSHIERSASADLKRQAVRVVLELIADERSARARPQLSALFAQTTCLLVESGGASIDVAEHVVAVGDELQDSGYWADVQDVTVPLLARDRNGDVRLDPAVRAALTLLQGVSTRRTGRVADALALFEGLAPTRRFLGRWEPLARYHHANAIRLLGRYSEAEKRYRGLVEEGEREGFDGGTYTKVVRQWADLLFLQGWFRDALEQLTALLDRDPSASLPWAETLRIVGHVRRFNFDLAAALDAYDRALTVAEEERAQGLVAKLQTNRCETLCWLDPARAIPEGEHAVEANKALGSKIEIGKAHAGLGIAHALAGTPRGKHHAARALEIQSETGYRSGVLFGLIASAVVARASGDRGTFERRRVEARALAGELEVYPFLDLPLGILADSSGPQPVEHAADWLDFAATEEACRRALAPIL